MKHFLLIFITFCIFVLCSCKMSHEKHSEKILQEWKQKEVIIPDDHSFKFLGRDTMSKFLWNKPYKIFTYIDSIGCTSCQFSLFDWKFLIDSCYRQQIDVGFIFVVHSSNFRQFNRDVRFSFFDYPIIYDYNNDFDKLNNFPPAPYRTFLLDKDNKVLLVGSPIGNIEMWEKYKSVMASVVNE